MIIVNERRSSLNYGASYAKAGIFNLDEAEMTTLDALLYLILYARLVAVCSTKNSNPICLLHTKVDTKR